MEEEEEECRLIQDWLYLGQENGDNIEASNVFDKLLAEVEFREMHNFGSTVPRLVAVQYLSRGPDIPIYRHPADSLPSAHPFTPIVSEIVASASRLLQRPFNHALIQFYRNGKDNISEHSDKTLDLVPGSSILNASFGAQRRMTLRYKANKNHTSSTEKDLEHEPRRANKHIDLPHNSLLIMPLCVNAAWTHAIRADKRAAKDQGDAEKAYHGARISITMREIGTFLTPNGKIYGCGATSKTRDQAQDVNTSESACKELVESFGRENRGSIVNIVQYYGPGSNALLGTAVPV